jgi:hypothetical protein
MADDQVKLPRVLHRGITIVGWLVLSVVFALLAALPVLLNFFLDGVRTW